MSRVVRSLSLFVVAALLVNGVTFAQEKPKFDRKVHMEKVTDLKKLQTDIRSAPDDATREGMAKSIEKLATEIFDLDLLRLEDQITKMQTRLKQQKADREKLIKQRVEMLLDPNAPVGASVRRSAPSKPYVVESIKKLDDGSMEAQFRITKAVQKTREVNYTVMVPHVRTRTVAGEEQAYTVNVPEQRTRTEAYTVQTVDSKTHKVTIPKGGKPDEVIGKFVRKLQAASKR